MQPHRRGARESEFDDLRRGEVFSQPPVEFVVDQVVIAGQPVEELNGHLLLRCQSVVVRGQQTRNVVVGDRVVLT